MPDGAGERDQPTGVNTGGFFTWGRDILRTVFSPKKEPIRPPPSTRANLEAAAARQAAGKPTAPSSPGTPSPGQVNPDRSPASRAVNRSAKKRKPGEAEREITQQLAAQGIWPYTLFSSETPTSTKVAGSIAQLGMTMAMSGGTYRNLPRTPSMGTRSSQRGFVAPELEPAIMSPPVKTGPSPSRRPGTVVPHMPPVTSPGSPGGPVAPGGTPVEQPRPTAPETRTQEHGEVSYPGHPDYSRTGSPAPDTAYPGSRPAPTAPSPTRRPGTPGPSTSKPGKTGTRAPVALPTLGKGILSLDALLSDTLRELTRRTPQARAASQFVGPGAAQPGTGTKPDVATLTEFAPGYADPTNDTCECEKKKPRKPRAPRTQCWSGSYTETATGLRKTRREQVPC